MHAGSQAVRARARTPYKVRLKVASGEWANDDPDRFVLSQVASRHGHTTYQARGEFYGVNPTTYSRMVRGLIPPGEEIIAAVLGSNPDYHFDTFFEVA